MHVVDSRARIITQENTEVLDLVGLLLIELINRQNLTVCLLDLLQQTHVVPESNEGCENHCFAKIRRKEDLPALSHNWVRGKDPHAVDLWVGGFFSGDMATHDLELMHMRLVDLVPVRHAGDDGQR